VAWDVIFYVTAEGSVPGADFLDGCPAKVRGTVLAVLDAVAEAPPPAFSGGGKWEAMHGNMGGWYDNPGYYLGVIAHGEPDINEILTNLGPVGKRESVA
jgi:hypothetical protein